MFPNQPLQMEAGSPLRSHGFLLPSCPQVIIICLVILDALLVLAELILDLKIIQPDKNNYAAMVVCQHTLLAQGGRLWQTAPALA